MILENGLNSRSDRYSDGLDHDSRSTDDTGSMPTPGYDDFHPTGSRRRRRGKSDGTATAKDRLTETFNTASRYVQSRDMSEMVDDVTQAARRNPRVAVIAVAAVGFLIGRSLRRSR